MPGLPGLAARNLWKRRGPATLAAVAIALGVLPAVALHALGAGLRGEFVRSTRGVDLVVGARGGKVNLALYTLFGIGDEIPTVAWESYLLYSRDPAVAWAIPIVRDDSYRGARVVGTSGDFFRYYRYGDGLSLAFASGSGFSDVGDVVLGDALARESGSKVGDDITIAHGTGKAAVEHSSQVLRIAGVIAATGTTVDQSAYVSLDALRDLHEDEPFGTMATPDATRHPLDGDDPESVMAEISARVPPAGVTGFLVGVRSPEELPALQEAIETYRGEPLATVTPGAAMAAIEDLAGGAGRMVLIFGASAALAGLVGLAAMMVAGLDERRAEFAAWRRADRPVREFPALVVLEAALFALAGAVSGIVAGHVAANRAAASLGDRLGLVLDSAGPSVYDLLAVLVVTGTAAIAGLLPAWLACRHPQSDGSTTQR